MIIADIHCHILPAVDDGSINWNMSIEMLEQAYNSGTRHIVATPHYCPGKFVVEKEKMYECVEQLNNEMFRRDINMKIYPGHEVRCTTDVVDSFNSGKISTLNDAGFLLLELPFSSTITRFSDLFFHIQAQTKTRVIFAHPERHACVTSNPQLLEHMAERGIMIQVNADSIRGNNGKTAKAFVDELFKKKLVSFVASDAHDFNSRTPKLDDVYAVVRQKYGDRTAKKVFYENQMNILKGRAPV